MQGTARATLDTVDTEEFLKKEIARKNFIRAVTLAQGLNWPKDEVRHLQVLALRQMACEYRNTAATHRLAQEWEFSRAELQKLLTEALKEYETSTDKTRSDTCYDIASGRYLPLREWIERFLNTSKL